MYKIKNNIYKLFNHTFLLGGLLGFIVFMYLFGVECLDVTNDNWLLFEGGDLTQHYVGWLFYRESPLTFPLGLIENLVYPNKISIIFMDSIPLFAIFFRFFEGILPETFQYFGIWIMLCLVLQGGFAALILRKLTNSKLAAIVGSVFFLFSTVMLHNFLTQDSLAGHWIILVNFVLWIYRDKIKNFKIKLLLYSLLAGMCILIHTYFIVMVGIISFFSLAYELFSKDSELNFKQFFIILISMVIVAIIISFLLGAFSNGENIISGNALWNVYSTPLNSFFRSTSEMGGSHIFKNHDIYCEFEGYAYLGFGVILLLVISVGLLLKYKRINWCIVSMCMVFFLMALGTSIKWNNDVIFFIELPDIEWLQNFCGMFRANGRFIWPTFYVVMLFPMFYIYKYIKKPIANIILICCLIIQIFDLTNIISYIQTFDMNKEYISPLISNVWIELAETHNEIFINNQERRYFFDLEIYAVENKMAINNTYAARRNENEIQNYINFMREQLYNNNPQQNVVYLFEEEDEFPECLNIYLVDDFYIGTVKKLQTATNKQKYINALGEIVSKYNKLCYFDKFDNGVTYKINNKYAFYKITDIYDEQKFIKEDKIVTFYDIINGEIEADNIYFFDLTNELISTELSEVMNVYYIDGFCIGTKNELDEAFNEYKYDGVKLGKGWDSCEENGTWTIGEQSICYFDVVNLDKSKTLELDVECAMEDVNVEVMFNGKKLYEFIPKGKIEIVNIDKDILKLGINELRFNIDGAKIPGNGDNRILGMHISKIELNDNIL